MKEHILREKPVKYALPAPKTVEETAKGDLEQNFARLKIAIIGTNRLFFDCLKVAVAKNLACSFSPFFLMEEWRQYRHKTKFDLAIFCLSGADWQYEIIAAADSIMRATNGPPFAVLADTENRSAIEMAFERGSRGFIPLSTSIELMVEAIKLLVAGGAYCPISFLTSTPAAEEPASVVQHGDLTPRENAVLEELREGRSNKVIADRLGVSEGTVKAHAHNIMKKLKVSNRTQVALHAQRLPAS